MIHTEAGMEVNMAHGIRYMDARASIKDIQVVAQPFTPTDHCQLTPITTPLYTPAPVPDILAYTQPIAHEVHQAICRFMFRMLFLSICKVT